jgi:hypothetical protein
VALGWCLHPKGTRLQPLGEPLLVERAQEVWGKRAVVIRPYAITLLSQKKHDYHGSRSPVQRKIEKEKEKRFDEMSVQGDRLK